MLKEISAQGKNHLCTSCKEDILIVRIRKNYSEHACHSDLLCSAWVSVDFSEPRFLFFRYNACPLRGKVPKLVCIYKQSIENANSARNKTYRLHCYPIYFIQQTPQPQKSIFSSTSFLHNCFQTFHVWPSKSN